MTLSEGELSREYPDGVPHERQPHWRKDFATDVPEDDYVARRDFAKFLVLTSGAFVAGQCWIAVMSLLRRSGPLPEMRIAHLDDIPLGGVQEFRYPTDDDPCLLLRPRGGELVAFSQKCTHLSCAVVPEMDKGHLHCPCHNGYFSVRDGRPTAGPPNRPLPRITLAVRDGVVYATGVELLPS